MPSDRRAGSKLPRHPEYNHLWVDLPEVKDITVFMTMVFSTESAPSKALPQDFQSHPSYPLVAFGPTSVSEGITFSIVSFWQEYDQKDGRL